MFNYATIPNQNLAHEVREYMEKGIEPCEFLQALLKNDLKRCFLEADYANERNLHNWVAWFYDEAPLCSWGSKADYKFWIERKQLENSENYGGTN